ncbi:MAG: NAD-dependent epimerase/dehydratase family protein [Candidatus Dormibacteria bacterium]
MKILVLGGTVFVGRHFVEAALSRGHEVTMFNRGQHEPDIFPEVEKLRGDRDGDLRALSGREWDAVVDTCGYVPRIVRQSAEALAGRVERYVFISTIGLYADFSKGGIDEHASVAIIEDRSSEDVAAHYGPLKALCEQVLEEVLPGRSLCVRPGLIVGPHDPTFRFTYWVQRAAQGGRALAPGVPEAAVQFIDVRDLVSWTLSMVEGGGVGIYNATGPRHTLTFVELLGLCREAIGSSVIFEWVPDAKLLDAGLHPFHSLPLWLPPDSLISGLCQVNCDAAYAQGLDFRPVAETINATLEWWQRVGRPRVPGVGLGPDEELRLLGG